MSLPLFVLVIFARNGLLDSAACSALNVDRVHLGKANQIVSCVQLERSSKASV